MMAAPEEPFIDEPEEPKDFMVEDPFATGADIYSASQQPEPVNDEAMVFNDGQFADTENWEESQMEFADNMNSMEEPTSGFDLGEQVLATAEMLAESGNDSFSSTASLLNSLMQDAQELESYSESSSITYSPLGRSGPLPSATTLFNAFVYHDRHQRPHTALHRHYEQWFKVIGTPGRPLKQGVIRPGDLVLRVAKGEGWGHISVVISPQLVPHNHLGDMYLRGEGYPRYAVGLYVQVVEVFPIQLRRQDRFARRICNEQRQVLADTLLLRPRIPSQMEAEEDKLNIPFSLASLNSDRRMENKDGFAIYESVGRQGGTQSMTTDRVRWIQRSLNNILGLQLIVDGILGFRTQNAIRGFQKKQGLAVDGVVGPETESRLIALGAQPFSNDLYANQTFQSINNCTQIQLIEPPKNWKQRSVSPAGALPNGWFDDRTNEYRSDSGILLALELSHYNKNDYTAYKSKHQEAIIIISEKIDHDLRVNQDYLRVTITGHADATGNQEYNEILSRMRAKNIANEICTSLTSYQNGSTRWSKFIAFNLDGKGYEEAVSKGKIDIDAPELRKVLVVVHKPNAKLPSIPPKNGTCKFKIRCCNFETKSVVEFALGELLSNSLPPDIKNKLEEFKKNHPNADKILSFIEKTLIGSIKERLMRKLPRRLRAFGRILGRITKYIYVDAIAVTALIEISEREVNAPKTQFFTYKGAGFRVKKPQLDYKEIADFLDKIPLIGTPEKQAIKDTLNELINQEVGIGDLTSDCAGDYVNFGLETLRLTEGGEIVENKKCVRKRVTFFKGRASMGTAGQFFIGDGKRGKIGIAWTDAHFPRAGLRINDCSACGRNMLWLPLGNKATGSELFLQSEGVLALASNETCSICKI